MYPVMLYSQAISYITMSADGLPPINPLTPGRQLIIDTTTKLAAAVEATLGWGTVQMPSFNTFLKV